MLFLTFLEHLKRMLGSSLIDNFLLTMSGPYGLSRASEVHQRNPWEFTHLKFENRSNTARSRFLQSSALPDKAVQFQLSWGKQRREPAVRWFGLSFASVPKCKERFARHPSQARVEGYMVLFLFFSFAVSSTWWRPFLVTKFGIKRASSLSLLNFLLDSLSTHV